jgi:hypothetical protein
MLNDPAIHEPQSLLDVREWKRKASEEIERIGFKAYGEKCHENVKALRERIERGRKSGNKAA